MNTELAQRRGQLPGAFDVNRLDLDGAIAKILFGDLQRDAEARQETADGVVECFWVPRNDISAIEEPLDRFLDLVGRKVLRKLANDLRPSLAMFSDRGGQGAVELAVQEELAVLRIKADRVGRQYVSGEVRCKSENVFAGLPRNAGLANCSH
ncbi:hypothetical protein N2603_22345 [Bradyrhizobium huanghuaihaiense]|uniref:hypothetical protein n=1 Tax=Bradyrhizobium huanghuaihaiense TaxID=990078 RepID=UPI0021AADBD2|nr:hypothetical protein [Bradyrhizobium sp. CB3035]UWU81106.1 hypothetical protein N2603_22345 [Bradyrhizobium sp. CB3035]